MMDYLKTKLRTMLNAKQEKGVLPSAYQQVDFIQSSGNQYIDTGVVLTECSEVEISFMSSVFVQQCIFGSRSSASQSNYSILFNLFATSKSIICDFDNYQNNRLLYTADLCVRNICKLSKSRLLVNDTTQKVSAYNAFSTPTSAYIFDMGGNIPSGYKKLYGNIYYCKILSNGMAQRNFIPCYRKSDDEVGMYDTVTKQFFGNKGSGSFTYGNEV